MLEIILLILAGAVLIFLETLLVGGIWCVAGIALCCWAVWLAFAQFGAAAAVCCAGVSVAACVGAFWFWLSILPKTRLGSKIYLSSAQSGRASEANLKSLIGKTGIAESLLVPSGKISVEGKIYDARSDLTHIDAGERVEVVGADTFCLIVRKI